MDERQRSVNRGPQDVRGRSTCFAAAFREWMEKLRVVGCWLVLLTPNKRTKEKED